MAGVYHIIAKEFRQRSRGLATLATIFFYSLAMSAVVFITVSIRLSSFQGNRYQFAEIGRGIAITTYFFQLIISIMLSLSFSASTIASERDQGTFETLNLTMLSDFEIVAGKLLSSFLYNIVLLISVVPLYMIAFIFGGLEPMLVTSAIAILISVTLMVSVLGLLLSLTSNDVRTALGRGFLALIVFGFGTGIFGMMTGYAVMQTRPEKLLLKILGFFSLLFNPIFPVFDLINGDFTKAITPEWGSLYHLISPYSTFRIEIFGYPIFDPTYTNIAVLSQLWLSILLFSVCLAIYPYYRSRVIL